MSDTRAAFTHHEATVTDGAQQADCQFSHTPSPTSRMTQQLERLCDYRELHIVLVDDNDILVGRFHAWLRCRDSHRVSLG